MSIKGKVAAEVARQLGHFDRAEQHADSQHNPEQYRSRTAQQAATVLNVVVVAVIGIIGILIYSQVNSSLPAPSNNQLDNASKNVTDGFADGMNLLPVVFVVMVAALVIAVVQRFRG